MEKATIIKKISAVETLLNIPEGETRTSEAGSVTEIVITRLKNSRNEKSSN